jgi:hypothetical protein
VNTRAPSSSGSTNPNDRPRSLILRYFYERNANATSKRGKKGSAAKIGDVRRDLKEVHGLTQQQVVSNLNYLVDKGWIVRSELEKTVRVKGGTIPSTTTWFEISAAGIDRIEGESEFTPDPKFAGINIHATGHNVITLGDGNVVNVKYSELHRTLEELRSAVVGSDGTDDASKLEVVANVETIKAQLVRQSPDRGIIAKAWTAVGTIVTAADFVDVVQKVHGLIGPLLP